MTLTASPSSASAVDRAAFGDLNDRLASETWFSTVDHRIVGRLLTGLSLLAGAAGMALWAFLTQHYDALLRGALNLDGFLGVHQNGGFSFARINNAVSVGLPYFVVLPLFIGIATVAIPRQIGATSMAFPRLQSFVLWGYLASLALFIASFAVVDGPPQVDLFSRGTDFFDVSNRATDVFLGSLILVTVLTLLGAANIAVTVVTRRRTGLRLGNTATFSIASLASSGVLLISSSVFLAALGLIELDRHFAGSITQSDGFGRIWSHALWLPGRPEALLFLLPGLGALVDIAASATKSKPAGGTVVNYLVGAYAMLTFTAWAGDAWIMNHVIQPNSTLQSSLVAIPLGLLLLVVLGTVGKGAKVLKPNAALLASLGMVLLIVLGVVNIVIAAIKGVGDTPGSGIVRANQFWIMTFAAPILGLIAASIQFGSEARDRKIPAGPASLAALASIGGLGLSALAVAALSYRSKFESPATGITTIALIGGLVGAAGLALAALLAFGLPKGALNDAQTHAGENH